MRLIFQQVKAQSAIEFMILVGFSLTVFLILLIVINDNISDNLRQKKDLEVKQLGISVQDEMNLAAKASDGYKREFFLNDRVSGEEYNINLTEGMVYILTKSERHSIGLPIPPFDGQIKLGLNKIRKINGKVKLNSDFEIISDYFKFIDTTKFKCFEKGGQNFNPEIKINGVPDDTESLALVIQSFNSSFDNKIHWILWNISLTTSYINENSTPTGSYVANNSFGIFNYSGPCFNETRTYSINLYALMKNITITGENLTDSVIAIINNSKEETQLIVNDQ